jgi:hypothetical protein
MNAFLWMRLTDISVDMRKIPFDLMPRMIFNESLLTKDLYTDRERTAL